MPTTGVIEADVKKELKSYLKAIGAWQYWPVPMRYGKRTIDCFFCYRGLFFAVETKRPGINEPTIAQDIVLRDIAAAGGGVCMENEPELPVVRAMIQKALWFRAIQRRS